MDIIQENKTHSLEKLRINTKSAIPIAAVLSECGCSRHH